MGYFLVCISTPNAAYFSAADAADELGAM